MRGRRREVAEDNQEKKWTPLFYAIGMSTGAGRRGGRSLSVVNDMMGFDGQEPRKRAETPRQSENGIRITAACLLFNGPSFIHDIMR